MIFFITATFAQAVALHGPERGAMHFAFLHAEANTAEEAEALTLAYCRKAGAEPTRLRVQRAAGQDPHAFSPTATILRAERTGRQLVSWPSERRLRFIRLVAECHRQLPAEADLVQVIRAKERYSVLLRLAALRNLIANAPLEVTHGWTYLRRRRAVRLHYGV